MGLLLFAFCVALPEGAHAAGGADIRDMFVTIITAFAPLWITAAILVLVMAGFVLMTTHDEGRLEKAKSTLISVFVGGILLTVILVMGPLNFIGIVYTGVPGFGMINSGNLIGMEAMGIADWLSAIAVMLGVLLIIVAVLRAVASLGDEAAYTAVRTSLLHIIVGIVVIAGAYLIRLAFFGSDTGPGQVVTGALAIEPNPLIGLISQKLLIVLNIITLIAVLILIYAGLRLIVSFGREEEFTAAKGLVIRVLLGIFVIVVSYAVVFFVASVFG